MEFQPLAPEERLRFFSKEDEERILKEAKEEEEKSKKAKDSNQNLPQPEPFENIFVPRKAWNAGPHIEGHEYLEKPILFVRFWKYTDSESCTNKEMCIKVVKEIQERHKEKGFGDITHNFLLGGDGNVYEGRGWDYRAPKDSRYKHDKKNYMDVAFIGDERNVKYDNQIIYRAAYRLLDFGRKWKIVDAGVNWTWEE